MYLVNLVDKYTEEGMVLTKFLIWIDIRNQYD